MQPLHPRVDVASNERFPGRTYAQSSRATFAALLVLTHGWAEPAAAVRRTNSARRELESARQLPSPAVR